MWPEGVVFLLPDGDDACGVVDLGELADTEHCVSGFPWHDSRLSPAFLTLNVRG